ncbi:Glutamate--cysteine ligase [Nitrincola lacisaponensis]|uniref:Glutamate--cysteine ligase n=1 Tax=Nitrincola lacisaponensis TaxID=267850 RepID=A0A063Y7I5_9GAMM|nr:glutamate--cysteine ligase [Nitrincola lacisaponensis]KDE41070.1 Glutamate--cysteine ligase [Nitrincola lacisaponensis]
MPASLDHNLNQLLRNGSIQLLTQLQHGLEKEGLRVTPSGHLAQSAHPKGLGSALTHSEITTDYSEALLEFITPVFQNTEDMLNHLSDLHRFSYEVLQDELIWCASMPCDIQSEAEIPIAYYGDSNIGRLKHIYRVGLQHRYGKMMQTIAGIHYNFSLPEQLWPAYQAICNDHGSMQDFRSASYFRLIRNFRRFSWLLLYLFGASPALCKSFMGEQPHNLETLARDTLYQPWATSLRMSDLGYSNRIQSSLNICYNRLDSYTDSLQRAIRTSHPAYERLGVKVQGEYRQLNSNILQIENEYYSDIRPKRVTESGEKPVQALLSRGVQYIEVRNTDINPLLPIGISAEQASFMDAFLVTCLLCNDAELSDRECNLIAENHQRIVNRGRQPDLTLLSAQGEVSREQLGQDILEQIARTASVLDEANQTQRYSHAVTLQREKLRTPELTPSAQVLEALRQHGGSYHHWIRDLSQQHRQTLMQEPLEPGLKARLLTEAHTSLLEQASIETADTLSFDAFLARYNQA